MSVENPKTLAELFVFAHKKHNRPDALNYKKDGSWQPISSDEMLNRAENIALGLYSNGIRKGDKVAIIASNSPDWTLTDAACQISGVIDVPIYTTLTPNSIEYIINDSEAKVFFIEDLATYKRIEEIFSNCPTIEKIIFFNTEISEIKNAVSLKSIEEVGAKLKAEKPNLAGELQKAISPNDIATLIYTSGTTGEPKGVMLTHTNLVLNALNASADFSFTKEDKPLSVLPLSHVFERTGMYLYILNGMSVYYAESIEKVPENLAEVRPTIFVGVPRLFEKVYSKARLKASQESRVKEAIFDWAIEVAKEYAQAMSKKEEVSYILNLKYKLSDKIVFSKFRRFFGGNLRFCITGGAAISDDIYLIFTGSGVPIMQGYGLTETSPVITSNTPFAAKLGSVGKPIRDVQVRIAEDGEIETKSPCVMLGYYKKEQATKDVFTEDGWFKTGDIGTIDEEGFLKITDRKKELFKTSGGKYIAPSPIEQMIKASQYVNQVVLIGNDRKFAAALIVPDFEVLESYAKYEGLNLKTTADYCCNEKIINLINADVQRLTANLARFESVKKIALLEKELTVESGELTPTMKIKRRIIDENYKEIIERFYQD